MIRTWTGQGWRGFEPGDLAGDDRGFLLGDGVFETMRIAGGRIRHSAQHRVRFEAACTALGLECPGNWNAVEAVAPDLPDGSTIRVTLTRGPGPRGIAPIADTRPRLFLADFPSAAPPSSVALHVSAIRRSPDSLACRHKTLSYADNVAARREAVTAGAGMALVLTADGHVSGGDCANIFWIAGARLVTPSLDCAIRDGVMRDRVIALASDRGMQVVEGRFEPSELASAGAVFVTNAAMGIVPVHAIGERTIKTGHPDMLSLRSAEAIAG